MLQCSFCSPGPRPDTRTNILCIKNRTNYSSKTLPSLVRFLMHQTLLHPYCYTLSCLFSKHDFIIILKVFARLLALFYLIKRASRGTLFLLIPCSLITSCSLNRYYRVCIIVSEKKIIINLAATYIILTIF